MRKLDEGQYDAIVLAAAGLVRLGLGERIRSHFDTADMLPCAGQGALAIETRTGSSDLNERLVALDHHETRLAILAERSVSRWLGGNCSLPIAAHATWIKTRKLLHLRAMVGHPERHDAPLLGAMTLAEVVDAGGAEGLGATVALRLLKQGAAAYLGWTPGAASPADAPPRA